ncbi:MAG: GDP-L-fucose synthase [Candidatus Omnitrophota bacterium]|jgi:GDP-L-fucose synthase
MNKDSKILIVGHGGAIENGLSSYFKRNNYTNVFSTSTLGLDTTIQSSVYAFFQDKRPEYVFLASTRSGGIQANIENPADFIYHNLESQNNIFYASWKFGVTKVLYYGGSCVYPKESQQPMSEDALLTGAVEKTSEPYSVAKIAGVITAQAFRRQYGLKTVVMIPATIYGPECDVDLKTAHVMGALIGKFAKAVKDNDESVDIWGTGNPRREFIYIDDFVDASLFLMNNYDDEASVNVGVGSDISIADLAQTIGEVTGFKGVTQCDASKPDGAMQKLLDSTRINNLGWNSKVTIKDGIAKTYQWYLENK